MVAAKSGGAIEGCQKKRRRRWRPCPRERRALARSSSIFGSALFLGGPLLIHLFIPAPPSFSHPQHTHRAQRNFRDRQRVREHTADARLADLASRIVSLEAEGAALRARARVLEAFVTLRAASSPSRSLSSEGDGGEGGCDAASSTPMIAAAALSDHQVARHAAPPTPPSQHGSLGATPAAGDPPLDWAAIAPLWRSITARLRGALPVATAAANPASQAAAGEVATLVQEASALLASVTLAEDDAYGGYGQATQPATPAAAAAARAAPPSPLALAASISLTPAQKAALVGARRAYLASMHSLRRGRATIAAALHGLPEPVPWTGAPAYRAFLHIAGAVEALGRHVREGRIAAAAFTGAAWRDILAPAQAGELILLTAPGRPCLLEMARALAVDAGVDEEADAAADAAAAAEAATAVGAQGPVPEEEEVDGGC